VGHSRYSSAKPASGRAASTGHHLLQGGARPRQTRARDFAGRPDQAISAPAHPDAHIRLLRLGRPIWENSVAIGRSAILQRPRTDHTGLFGNPGADFFPKGRSATGRNPTSDDVCAAKEIRQGVLSPRRRRPPIRPDARPAGKNGLDWNAQRLFPMRTSHGISAGGRCGVHIGNATCTRRLSAVAEHHMRRPPVIQQGQRDPDQQMPWGSRNARARTGGVKHTKPIRLTDSRRLAGRPKR